MIKTLLNTLFVQTQGAYLRLDHETVKVEVEKELRLQIPLHHLEGIVVFGNVLLSPLLIHRCAKDGRSIVWCNEYGVYEGRLVGPTSGNVLLRRAQYRSADDQKITLHLAYRFVEGKIRGARHVLQRAYREYKDERLNRVVTELRSLLRKLEHTETVHAVRGVEGLAASYYFEVFPYLIRVPNFTFAGREKRPPRDPINAALSFAYSLLARDCISALESVGLDPQIGFLHALRPGRPALALDLMEEFRHPFADRLVLSVINRQQLQEKDFDKRPGGAVFLNENGRKTFLAVYQKRKQEEVTHPVFKESVPIGLLPYVQARLLARFIRGDLQDYFSYRWR